MNSSSSNSVHEEEYEVERIDDHRFTPGTKRKIFQYWIKWLNYPDSDNTWEREANVYSTELLAEYWSKKPKDDADRQLFVKQQSKKKDPIVLGDPPSPPRKVAQVITASSQSPSPNLEPIETSNDQDVTPLATTTTKTPTVIPVVIAATENAAAEESISKLATTGSISSFFKTQARVPVTIASSSSSPVPVANGTSTPQPAEQQQRKINDVFKASQEDMTGAEKGKEKEGELTKVIAVTEQVEEVTIESSDSDSEEEEQVQVVKESHKPTRSASALNSETRKRTRSTYTDYFTEQHNKKKKRVRGKKNYDKDSEEEEEEDEIYDEDEVVKDDSLVSTPVDEENVVVEADGKSSDEIIFDEAFDRNPEVDWSTMADKVEYIGREVEGGPIYCAVKWKDEVRTFHSLELVRVKRPDLVIDAFLKLVYP